MKCNSEKATYPAIFSIALALTAAGFLFFTLCVSTTAMATDAYTIDAQISSADAQKSMTPGAIAPETPDAGPPALEEQEIETDKKPVDENPMPIDSEQSLLEEQKRQFLTRHILFASNSFQLEEQAQALIRKQAVWPAANPDINVQILGCCDQSGFADYNRALGKKRANAVKTFLENLGIDPPAPDRGQPWGDSPLRTTTDQTAARNNRQVEFNIQAAA